MCHCRAMVAGVLLLALQSTALANPYLIDPGSQVVGRLTQLQSGIDESLYAIAVEQGLGAEALARANPDVDPWLPAAGASLQLPTQYVLPAVEHTGIVINLSEMRLYYFSSAPANSHDRASVTVYPIGIGRQGWETPLLTSTITSIVKNPTWTPPASIHREYRAAGLNLPDVVPAGADNPLGEYAMRIGDTSYLLHGTNNPSGVGLRVSHGCIRLYPQDIKALASALSVGTPIRVVNQPIKIGRAHGRLYVQAHQPVQGGGYDHTEALTDFFAYAESILSPAELQRVKRSIRRALETGELYSGIPIVVQESARG